MDLYSSWPSYFSSNSLGYEKNIECNNQVPKDKCCLNQCNKYLFKIDFRTKVNLKAAVAYIHSLEFDGIVQKN